MCAVSSLAARCGICDLLLSLLLLAASSQLSARTFTHTVHHHFTYYHTMHDRARKHSARSGPFEPTPTHSTATDAQPTSRNVNGCCVVCVCVFGWRGAHKYSRVRLLRVRLDFNTATRTPRQHQRQTNTQRQRCARCVRRAAFVVRERVC